MGRFRSRSRSRSYGRRRSRSRSNERGRNDRRSASYDSRSPSPDDEGYRIHVADLGIDPSKRELETSFEKFGPINEVWVARNPPCFAFIVYKYREDAELAIREMDGRVLSGGRIRCSIARPRTRGRRRRGFDPNMRCYSCGEKGHFSRDCTGGWQQRRRNRSSDRSYRRRRSRTRSRSRSRSRGRRSRSGSGTRHKTSKRPKERSLSKSPRRGRKESKSSEKRHSKSSDRDRNAESSKWEKDGEENGKVKPDERYNSPSPDRLSPKRQDHSPEMKNEEDL